MAASIARATRNGAQSAQVETQAEQFGALSELARQLNIVDFGIAQAAGRLIFSGVAQYQLQKDQFLHALKEHDGWETAVIDIAVEQSDMRGLHTVQPGETLASIAKLYFGSASRDKAIFAANRDRLNEPEQIFPGQQLVIPC